MCEPLMRTAPYHFRDDWPLGRVFAAHKNSFRAIHAALARMAELRRRQLEKAISNLKVAVPRPGHYVTMTSHGTVCVTTRGDDTAHI